MHVILASRSPRRLDLLQNAGLTVEVRPSNIDETTLCGESVADMVKRLSQQKAMVCDAPADIPVIAADTLVAIHGMALGQPANLTAAKQMLLQLSDQSHDVLTGVCVRLNDSNLFEAVRTRVQFRKLDEAEIDTYLAHNEVLDKAGSYAVQAGAASFIEAIDGPLDNVIGLPVRTTLNMIAEITFSGNTI